MIGCGLTFLETAANPYATELGPKETATSRLNFSQSFNGLGCMFATFVVGQFLFSSNDSNEGGNLPEIKHADAGNEDESKQSGTHNLRLLFGNKMFLFGLAALLAYEVAEISINSYFINFVTGMGWMADKSAAMVITAALFVFMIGRFIGSWIMRRVAAETMLTLCAVGSVACMVLVMLDIKGLSLAALIANYLFEAIMFPTIFSLTKSASSILMMTPVGGCGFLLMGLIADRTDNFLLPFFIPLVGFAIVLAYAMRKRAFLKKA